MGVFFFCKFMFLVLLGAYTEVELLGSMVTLFLTFWVISKLLFKVTIILYILISNLWGFQCLHILMLVFVQLFYYNYSREHEVCAFSLLFPGDSWCQRSLNVLIDNLHIFFGELSIQILSVQFSRSVESDSLRPHGLQHARPPCPSPIPEVYPNSCPLSWWYHPTISFSVIPFSSCPQSFPASGSFQMSQFFSSGGQSIRVSASTSVLPMNTQDWSPLGWTGWIFLKSKGLAKVFSNTTVQKHQFCTAQLSLWFNFHIYTWLPSTFKVAIAREKGTTEDELAGWHHWLNGRESQLVMDREAWRAAIHGVTKSRTRLSDWSDLIWSLFYYTWS